MWTKIISPVIAALLLAAVCAAQGDRGAPPIPAPGRLVDIGGWRLHLHCAGEAVARQPTVILEDDRRKSQAALARLSRNGKQIMTDNSGHHIQIEQPELVITAILDVLRAGRK
ncbi:MAG: hypothetical protein M3373_01535 [Gemmatimonadota bacterium]|nr:hypothetical protein [Gemmatimonadota bacterium]